LAGYRLGSTGERLGRDGLPITLHLGYDPADELQLLAVPEVVRVLAELNIAVVPTPVSAAELAASTAPDAVSSFDFYLQTHRESADPGATVLSGSCALTTGWCDTAYDELAAAQAKEMGPDRRAAFVREAYQLSYQADALLVLGYPDSLAAYRTDRFESFGLSEGALSLRSGSWAYYQAKPVLRHDAPWPAVSVRSNRWGWYSGVAIVALGIVGYAVVRFRDWRKRRADGA
jgi:peptide/nickel transport system substrate-binding protein